MSQVIVDGKEYKLNEKQVAAMKYIEEAEAIEKGQTVPIILSRPPSPISTKKHSNSFSKFSKP